jgi:hypothetical protein
MSGWYSQQLSYNRILAEISIAKARTTPTLAQLLLELIHSLKTSLERAQFRPGLGAIRAHRLVKRRGREQSGNRCLQYDAVSTIKVVPC